MTVYHSSLRDGYLQGRHNRTSRRDWIALAMPTIKLAEVLTLWHLGAGNLAFIASITWYFAFGAGIVLQSLGRSREFVSNNLQYMDLIKGDLPNAFKAGKTAKIVLGVPINVRSCAGWRLAWTMMAPICLVVLGLTAYLLYSLEDRRPVYYWTGFQLGYRLAAHIFFYFSEETQDMLHSYSRVTNDGRDIPNIRKRIVQLLGGVSRYLILKHARLPYAYPDDVATLDKIQTLLVEVNFTLSMTYLEDDTTIQALERSSSQVVSLEIVGIIGDTVLSSATWLASFQLETMTAENLYDSCLVAIRADGILHLIPAARVFSRPEQVDHTRDPERPPQRQQIARGTTNLGHNFWTYWIPIRRNTWLQIRALPVRIIGTVSAKIVSDEQITSLIRSPEISVSLDDVQSVLQAVELAAQAGKCLCEYVSRWNGQT